MKVLHLIKSLGLGGAENLLVEIARSRKDCSVEYEYAYCLRGRDHLAKPIRELGSQVHCLGSSGRLGVVTSWRAVARLAKDRDIDLIHAHLPLSGVAARAAGRMARLPVVYTEHNMQERYHSITRALNALTWPLLSQVIAVSSEVKDSIIRAGLSQVPIGVIHNGVPVSRLRQECRARKRIRSELGIPAEAPLVGQVAVFRVQKRLDLWIEAASVISKRVPDAHFILVGDGPERRNVEACIARTKRIDPRRFHLPGLQSEASQFLSAMDVLLISSDFEGLPLVLLEAMAMDTPVVSTDVGGISEALTHESNGILVPRGDIEKMATAVVRVLSNPAKAEQYASNARQTVEEAFSAERMLSRVEDIYSKVLRRF